MFSSVWFALGEVARPAFEADPTAELPRVGVDSVWLYLRYHQRHSGARLGRSLCRDYCGMCM